MIRWTFSRFIRALNSTCGCFDCLVRVNTCRYLVALNLKLHIRLSINDACKNAREICLRLYLLIVVTRKNTNMYVDQSVKVQSGMPLRNKSHKLRVFRARYSNEPLRGTRNTKVFDITVARAIRRDTAWY